MKGPENKFIYSFPTSLDFVTEAAEERGAELTRSLFIGDLKGLPSC